MLKRYIGPIDEVSVTIAGQDYGVVKSGDAIPIPDDVADSVAWPESNWEDVKSKSRSKKEDKETDTGSGDSETETNTESGETPDTANETSENA